VIPVPAAVRRATDARRRRRQYRATWGPLVDRLQSLVAAADDTVFFLHLPKTGGSSLTRALHSDPQHLLVLTGLSYRAAANRRSDRRHLATADPALGAGRTLVLKLGHESYDAVEWLERRSGPRPLASWTIVRPARTRIESMFTDYWMRVAEAEAVARGAPVAPERRTVLDGYRADAVHYRRPDGFIDGRAWFTAFTIHGGGIPFSLAEVFGTPDHLHRLLDRGTLTVIPTSGIDAFSAARGLDGARRRVSTNRDDPAVRDALVASEDLIDELARRDAAFDRVLADHLDDPTFRP